MSSYRDSLALREKIERSVKMAGTYLRKAGNALSWYQPRPISTSYWDLLDQALETADDIVWALPDDFFDDRSVGDPFGMTTILGGDPGERYNLSDEPLERAEKVAAALRARRARNDIRRTIERLEQTTGRTPEEAEMYHAKATELRRKHRMED